LCEAGKIGKEFLEEVGTKAHEHQKLNFLRKLAEVIEAFAVLMDQMAMPHAPLSEFESAAKAADEKCQEFDWFDEVDGVHWCEVVEKANTMLLERQKPTTPESVVLNCSDFQVTSSLIATWKCPTNEGPENESYTLLFESDPQEGASKGRSIKVIVGIDDDALSDTQAGARPSTVPGGGEEGVAVSNPRSHSKRGLVSFAKAGLKKLTKPAHDKESEIYYELPKVASASIPNESTITISKAQLHTRKTDCITVEVFDLEPGTKYRLEVCASNSKGDTWSEKSEPNKSSGEQRLLDCALGPLDWRVAGPV
jgi:hypothetical protein